MPELLTIGHSNHDSAHFASLLELARVEVVADVRSWPQSRYAPWADRYELPQRLRLLGRRHVFLGEQLGGRPNDDACYDADGRVLYGRAARTPNFLDGLARLRDGIAHHRVAVMCSEEDPTHCHRRLLVAKVLLEEGIQVMHIRGDGRIAPEPGIGPQALGLFDDEDRWWRSTQSVSQRRRLSTSSRV